MSIIDSIDEQLVRLLAQDARQNSEALAKQLKLSAATVRRRLRKLIRSGLLHIIGVIDPTEFGFSIAAMIALDVDHNNIEQVVETLAAHSEIGWISTTTGRFDIIALARFHSTDSLSDFSMKVLAHIEGLKDSETFICLNVNKGRFAPLV